MRVAGRHERFAQINPRRFQRVMVGNFQCRWQKAGRKDFLHRARGFRQFRKRRRQRRTRRRKRKQPHRDLGDHAEHSFGAHKQSDQIESGFIFMHAAAGLQDFATC